MIVYMRLFNVLVNYIGFIVVDGKIDMSVEILKFLFILVWFIWFRY